MAGTWIRVGTVSVTQNSKKVTGSGTTWASVASNKPAKGHTFWGPDGKAYEVDYVESDTVLYLADTYLGATASGQAYRIDNTRDGTVPALSRKVSEFYAYQQGYIDALGLVVAGNGDVTFTAPDGQQVTVPALANMLSKSGNLAGLGSVATARRNLGISAFADTLLDDSDAAGMQATLGLVKQDGYLDVTYGRLMGVGAFGLGSGATNLASFTDDLPLNSKAAFFRALMAAPGGPGYDVSGICMPFDGTPIQTYLAVSKSADRAFIGRKSGAGTSPAWTELHTKNGLPYETGTFTPTIAGSGATGDGTYSIRRGSYTRIGRLVTFSLAISWSAHTGTGALRILGLPFVSSSAAEDAHFKWVAIHSNNLTFAGQLTAGVVNADSYIRMYQMLTNAAAVEVPMDSSAQIELNGSYFI